jgi:1,4-alpha-glucan branching enzyme
VVQDDQTKIFSAQVWNPAVPYVWKKAGFKPKKSPLLIYECHVGMGQDAEKVGTYTEFKDNVLPRVAKDGYNAIQVMAIQEHPYYGSFGYHVSSFFAPSSRFGTPEELKALIDEAHRLGISVIMDIVHSHAVKNEVEGLGNLAGDPNQFFYAGDRHEHPAWDSLCFDYGKDDVMHFLLSNCKYWLEEFHFDGFRFDGVTSMLYYSHGLGEAFCGYPDYFNGHQDDNAICYLTLANKLIHEVNPEAITIAEEVSGMPGLAAKFEDGGYGFDYRMAMNIPDYWIKTIKEQADENWKPSSIFWEVKNRRPDEKTISYCESHDQALVGDKTIIFRLIDADMYWHFAKKDENGVAERGIALHKMIRLVTAAAINGGYLNFMGNEFGHPEWIDFPREGNGWSYKYARRQWHLVDNHDLCYHWLGDFDREMLRVIKSVRNFQDKPVVEIWHNDGDQVLAFMRGDLIFVFNFSPTQSFTDYGFLVPTGSYEVVLNTDATQFGGHGFADDTITHLTNFDPLYVKDHKEWLKLYIPARSAVVLKKN